jgi:hypothetical protein
MAKKEQEMYEGMPVIEAADQKALEKKLEKMEERPDKYVVRIGNRSTKKNIGHLKIMRILLLSLFLIQ